MEKQKVIEIIFNDDKMWTLKCWKWHVNETGILNIYNEYGNIYKSINSTAWKYVEEQD